MAAWNQVGMSSPASLFAGQPDYAKTMFDILSSPGQTLRSNRESDRNYAAKLQELADQRAYQEGMVGVGSERNRLTAAGQGAAGPYGGTGKDAQDMNILLDPNSDPGSAVYQAAYASQYLTPKPYSADDGTGNIVTRYQYPVVPPGIRPPVGGAAAPPPTPPPPTGGDAGAPPPAPAAGAPAPPGPPGAPGAPPSPSDWYKPKAPEVTGAKPPTEQMLRAKAFMATAAPSLNVALSKWDTLAADTGGKWGEIIATKAGKLPGPLGSLGEIFGPMVGRGMQSEEYQVAADAVSAVINDYNYVASGANLTEKEKYNATVLAMPQLNDRPAAIARKKAQLQDMVEGIKAVAEGRRDPASLPKLDTIVGAGGEDEQAGGTGEAPAPPGGANGRSDIPNKPPPPGFKINPPGG